MAHKTPPESPFQPLTETFQPLNIGNVPAFQNI